MNAVNELLISLAEYAARRNDRHQLMLFRKKINKIKSIDSDLATNISKAISSKGGLGALRRFQDMDAIPIDFDSGMELVSVETEPCVDVAPILTEETAKTIERFLLERKKASALATAGLKPPTSLALMGPPGTGKTTLARWISIQLNIPFFLLDLASVVTSYLGQTGQNIKRVLDRARLEPSVLLLDEFDALGRARVDDNDIGEMKRVVTVLLQEIEKWPMHGVVIAATNLPELVDPAFRRRFSRWIRLTLPNERERVAIFKEHYKGPSMDPDYYLLAAKGLVGASGAEIGAFANRVATNCIISSLDPVAALISELADEVNERHLDRAAKKLFIDTARAINPAYFTYRRLGDILSISQTSANNLARERKIKRGGVINGRRKISNSR